ncbi:cytochrome P450 9e2-like [Belonocnema kinseyi]|uniref:cytochrome P450 9e2-like n=1 Tax=Belonocnema kinseyi TaxID=2817044 RepID=UPI00143D25DE|nr:cytochrome P450 9e2-like [Belonocnema kinseyi]
MDFLTVILTIFAIGMALCFYNKNRNVFKVLDIPHDPPIPILGNMAPCLLRKMNVSQLIEKLYNAYPEAKYFGLYDFQTPTIVIRDPEIIKSVAIKNFEIFPDHRGFTDVRLDPLFGISLFSLKGDSWRDMRNILSPSFTSSKMKIMFNLIMECSVKFTDALLERSKDKQYIANLKDVFTRLSADVISSCAFGISVDSMKDPENKLYVIGRKATDFEGILSLKFLLIRNCRMISRLLGVSIFSKSSNRFFTNVISSNIKTRKEKGITRADFLQMLIEAKDKNNDNRKLSLQEIAANVVLFFFGGLDTVSTVVCFIAYEIAVNPKVQEKLHEEIDAVLKGCNGQSTYNEINNMPYLDAVISETLRLYPPVGFIDRVCNRKFELPPVFPGKKSVTVEPGMVIYFPIFALQHDRNNYENPEKFDPERFLGDKKVNVNSASYIPFGIGPRKCIGSRFALLEMKVMIFHLLSRCILKPCSKTPIPIKLKRDTFTMMPEGGFWLKVAERK